MSYIIIETFNDAMYNICTNEEGYTLFFNNLKEAEKEASNCQDGIIIDLNDGKIVKCRESLQESIERMQDAPMGLAQYCPTCLATTHHTDNICDICKNFND